MTRGAVQVRRARPGDLDLVARIYTHYVTASAVTFEEVPPSCAEWTERYGRIQDAGLPFLVAESDEQVVGYAYCAPWRSRPAYRHTAEDTVYVAPGAEGQGVGRALLDELLRRCAAVGIRQVIAVITDSGDQASVALHRRCGFREVGRLNQVGRKHGQWWDTVLFQASLEDPDETG